ncbi:MAG: amylo-alpha-1,6-glucosidase, partial [Salegentibacter sp.]
ANTRCYHGLLIASFSPPVDRKVLVAKIEERVQSGGIFFELSANQYPEKIHPKGYQYLKNFEASPFPKWKYAAQGWQLEKKICMRYNSNTTLVEYKNTGRKSISLKITPLYSFADFHSCFSENDFTDFYSEFHQNHLKTYPHYDSRPLFTSWSKGVFSEERAWYKNVLLPKEEERGLNFHSDYYKIGHLHCELWPGEKLFLIFSAEKNSAADAEKIFAAERKRWNDLRKGTKNLFFKDLLAAGNQFVVKRKSTRSLSILAGYHWFSDWGRDTMIAMRGLCIAPGKKEISKAILTTFLENISEGMLPNRFPDHSEDMPEFNNIDGSLWLFVAMYEYYKKFGDKAFIKKHLNRLQRILIAHLQGTRFNIHVTPEGFLYGGEEGMQLTWMDARVNGKVITPRIGCPVEINALWYNALKIYSFFCGESHNSIDPEITGSLEKFKKNFAPLFTNSQGTLYDVIIPGIFSDNAIRPNQLYCLSLPFTFLKEEQQKQIFQLIKKKLYTPFGLRTLDEENPDFKAHYSGGPAERDAAYHQGTVWPFLLYDYFHAFLRLYGASEKNKKIVLHELESLQKHFYEEEGLHCISEVFDGKEPKQGKGCIHQAWSVAAILKLYSDYKLDEMEC